MNLHYSFTGCKKRILYVKRNCIKNKFLKISSCRYRFSQFCRCSETVVLSLSLDDSSCSRSTLAGLAVVADFRCF